MKSGPELAAVVQGVEVVVVCIGSVSMGMEIQSLLHALLPWLV